MPRKKADPPAVTGYRRKPRYRDITCDWFELEEGEDPLTVTIQTNLTFEEVNAIPTGKGLKWREVWEVIYPYVVGWNLTAPDDNGEIAPVPPPAEAGPDAFMAMDPQENVWLLGEIRYVHIGGPKELVKNMETERKNESTPSGSTPAPDGGKS